jgi:ethanolamine utilization microcompartment shell protein EutL
MTERTYHRLAISLMVAGIAVGAVCWLLTGPALWIVAGVSAALLIAGIAVASKVSPDARQMGPRK